jgi:ketosteroid isomerase-like protein
MSILLDLVHSHYRGLETGDLELATAPFADNVATETPSGVMEGIEAFQALAQAFFTAAPDMKLAIRNTWEVGDTVIVEGLYSGTQTGPLATPDGGEIPATGRSFTFPYVDILRAEDGRFIEHRVYWDNVTFLSQLGLLPPAHPHLSGTVAREQQVLP